MWKENRKIILWFFVALLLAFYAQKNGWIPASTKSSNVLGESIVKSPGFDSLLKTNK